jgi:hypothetical protein
MAPGTTQLRGRSNTPTADVPPLDSETPPPDDFDYPPGESSTARADDAPPDPETPTGNLNPDNPDNGPGVTATHHAAAAGVPPNTADARRPEQGDSIQPVPLVQEPEDDDPGETIQLPKLETTQCFLDALGKASLETSGMQPEDIESLRNPGPVLDLEDPSPLLWSLCHFVNNCYASWSHYDNTRKIELLNNPAAAFLSFDQVKWRLRWLSGVVLIEHDMCPRTCVAFTGPYSELDACPRCSTPRYFPNSDKPQRRFTTVPIGPVIQAFYGSRDIAEHMHYLERRLAANVEAARLNGNKLDKYDDTSCGRELLDAWESGALRKHDVALQLSIDGAQLRSDKASEAWVFIWVVHNLPPELRYKKHFVIPAAIVPGPNKPGDIDTFLFPTLAHVSALQHEGLKIYDACDNTYINNSSPLLVFATADSLGSASMSGMVGHSGRYGCRLYCDMPSRHRKGDGHYYPAMHRPHNYQIAGSSHPDITNRELGLYRINLDQKYQKNLKFLLEADTDVEFQARRLSLGLCKQTLFNGLPRKLLPVPNIFTMDIMHLTTLNDPDLLLKLFTGKLNVYAPDDRSTWDWAVFYQNTTLWNAHGETVERAVKYLPSSFGRAPRNPAKKLNTGYKAWEFQQYLYGFGPTFFRHLLPRKYWLNFCKLVASV